MESIISKQKKIVNEGPIWYNNPMQKKYKNEKTAKKGQKSYSGPISINSKGVGFFNIPETDKTLEIENVNLNKALNGDLVKIIPTGKKIRDKEQAKVTEIISRSKDEFVGTIQKNGDIYFLIPDDKKMYVDIFIENKPNKEDLDKKVLVKITEWKNNQKNPNGKIVKVIGRSGENNTEMESIVLEKGFKIEFPKEVAKEADSKKEYYKKHFAEEVKKRKDLRNTLTFTIDPVDAKDFDDAISFKELSGNEYEIGVHIADVSHFVQPKTLLDKEAEKRGLSVYLVDRTIPMLPEILSNDLCSLNPNEDKFTFSVIFKINNNGDILDKWFGKTVIHSDKRFTYEEAQEIISNKKNGPYQKELWKLNEIAKALEKKKYLGGAINFETEEVKFILDEKGKPVSVYKKQRLDTHKLVEEYMLLANRAVAEFIFMHQNKNLERKGAQSVYRIHGKPDPERIEELAIFLKALGFDLKNKDGEVTSRDINKLLKEIEGTPNEELIKTATIRSMAKAIYSTKNVGHFGLAFKYYTHFTSPIRRYPDLLVHRFLERELAKGKIEKNEYEKFEAICLATSELEKKAADAERASIKYKQVEYMQNHVGEEFSGTITGVTDWGIYVEENETKCEGMVSLKTLSDDFYELDEKKYTIKGQKTGKKFTLGDKVRFKILRADIDKRILDYSLV